jgi:DNA polymerase-1
MKQLYKNILNTITVSGDTTREKNDRVLIVDGMNTFIRCWSSIPTMNENGEHVGGVSGFMKSVGYAIKQTKPTRVVIVFDGKGGSQRRKKEFDGYKSQRSNNKLRVNRQYADLMSDEDEKESMKRQFVWLNEYLNIVPVTTMIYDNVEADDVMAYIATHIQKEGQQSVIMSTDKDFLQLVDEKTIVWSPTKKIIYNRDKVYEEYGIPSKNILIYRILDGDVSDNIPGVKGCGIKTLIKRFPELTQDSLIGVDELLLLAEQKRGDVKLYDTILESKEQIITNEKLMQLKDVDISGNIKMKIMNRYDEKIKPLNKINFLTLMTKYGMQESFGDVTKWLNDIFGKIVVE